MLVKQLNEEGKRYKLLLNTDKMTRQKQCIQKQHSTQDDFIVEGIDRPIENFEKIIDYIYGPTQEVT